MFARHSIAQEVMRLRIWHLLHKVALRVRGAGLTPLCKRNVRPIWPQVMMHLRPAILTLPPTRANTLTTLQVRRQTKFRSLATQLEKDMDRSLQNKVAATWQPSGVWSLVEESFFFLARIQIRVATLTRAFLCLQGILWHGR